MSRVRGLWACRAWCLQVNIIATAMIRSSCCRVFCRVWKNQWNFQVNGWSQKSYCLKNQISHVPILSFISWHLGHIRTAATFIWHSSKLWSLWNASNCPEELRGWVSSVGVFDEHVLRDTAPPVAEGSCLGHLVLLRSCSCFKVFWGVMFWLRSNTICYLFLSVLINISLFQ